MNTPLDALRSGWDQAAETDPLYNILTIPGKQNHGWSIREFYAHGQAEIDQAIHQLDHLQIRHQYYRALDFGCGAGRLTQALAKYFYWADGVDLSSAMINLARQHNSTSRVRYYVNSQPNLTQFTSARYDLIYSRITLQHMPSELQHEYVREFIRLLNTTGIAMFDIPEGPDYRHPDDWLSMHATPRTTVEQWIQDAGGTVLDVELLPEQSTWDHWRYVARPEWQPAPHN